MTHFFHFACLQPRKSWSWNPQRSPKSEPYSSSRRSKASQNGKGVSVESQLLEETLASAVEKSLEQMSWTCSVCSQTFTRKSILVNHIKGQHLNQMRYNCTYCEKMFWNPEDLDGHISAKHTNIKLHVCNSCGKSFHHKKSLVRHVKENHLGVDST